MTTLGIQMSAKINLRSNFAIHHLRAAAQAAQSAHAVEKDNDTSKHGRWFDDMMMHVPVAIVMAAAALEANSNEIVQDILDRPALLSVAASHLESVKALKDDLSGNALDKYRKLANILNKTPVTGGAVWQNAGDLLRFRNSFIHFKPAWDHEDDIHKGNLVTALRRRLPISPIYNANNFMFPYSLLTYECANWAVQSVRKFADEFCALIGVEDRFTKV
ncbi:hypothetical protein [Bradyrhizobium sp. BRP56]|uniref:hypothetical protein n=1 Tax=Bradyrhizobium sp. BRP56 TaxID=2793819 RepID=UPI001CD60757|nr:hypothetical protein [Bradyrhizobium sp. BRP56]MCA1397220.1 hypothetical protein [Bradyrhizobium sp. BRP56]